MRIANMHFWFVLLLFGCILLTVNSRPQRTDYNNDSDVDETEEEDAEAEAEAYSADDDASRLRDQESLVRESEMPLNRHIMDLSANRYMQRNVPDDNTARVNADILKNVRINRNLEVTDEKSHNFNEQLRSYPKRCQSNNKYSDSLVDQQEIQHLENNDISKSNNNRDENELHKRTNVDVTANEEGDMIFEKNRDHVSHVNKNEYNANDASDPEQQRYFKQYYNTMQAENKDMVDGKTHDGSHYNLRDRREVNIENANQESKEIGESKDSEDDESAIKRHIKKLTSDELDRLLNSLSEEKREMLKKIIDEPDSNTNGYIDKREITKKAEAVEEINYIENSQSDLSKVHSGSSSLDDNVESASSQSTEVTKGRSNKQQQDSQTDNPYVSPKSSEPNLISVANIELANNKDEAIQKNADNSLNTFSLNIDPKNQADVIANIQGPSKIENKREVNSDDLVEINDDSKWSGQDYLNEQDYLSSHDENLANLMNDENQHHEDKARKREAFYDNQSELSDSFKSLQDSFPNSNTYDDSAPYTGPLIRVKRKNCDQVVKKKPAELLPDNKVAYIPYKAEIEEEYNDEGNEFDNEGFYDRSSNFVRDKPSVNYSSRKSENSLQSKRLNADSPKSTNDNVDSDTVSIGSDTDSVLSGVEGVDDNLMYSSTRIKRTAEDKASILPESKINSITSQTKEDMKSDSANYSAPHYQENDAFGPLPQNYNGDLARYKRIRRVKQLPVSEDQQTS